MLFKFPLPGPLKGKLLPKEGLDGDRLRAGWVRAGVPGLGSGLGFLAGVPGWGFGADLVPAWFLRERLRFGAELGLGSWSGVPGWGSGLGTGLVWISGWPGFRAG